MMQRKQGKIIFVSSVVGRLPIPYRSAYTASKHAMQAFADCLRAEMAAYNIQVLVSSPGYVATDVSRNAWTGYGTAHGGKLWLKTHSLQLKQHNLVSRLYSFVQLWIRRRQPVKRRSIVPTTLCEQCSVMTMKWFRYGMRWWFGSEWHGLGCIFIWWKDERRNLRHAIATRHSLFKFFALFTKSKPRVLFSFHLSFFHSISKYQRDIQILFIFCEFEINILNLSYYFVVAANAQFTYTIDFIYNFRFRWHEQCK